MNALKTKLQPRIREQLTHGKRKMTKHHPREPLNIKLTLANNWDKFSSRRILHVNRNVEKFSLAYGKVCEGEKQKMV